MGKGAEAVTTAEAAKADIVLLAIPWSKVKELAKSTDLQGKIVIDPTNHFTPDHQVEDLGGLASLAEDSVVGKGHRVLFISGDDQEAKAKVSEIISAIGYAPIDLGSLAVGSKYQQAKGGFSGVNLIKL